MKTAKMSTILVMVIYLIICPARHGQAAPLGTAVTYKGELTNETSPVEGFYDFEFALYDNDDPNTRMQIGSMIALNDIEVIDGRFQVELDFGNGNPDVFNGDSRWLEFLAWPSGSNPATSNALSRMQEINAVPYSLLSRGIFVDAGRNVGVGTTAPVAPLDVRRENAGANQVAGYFSNPSDDKGSQVSIDLNVGTSFPTAWRLVAGGDSFQIGNAVVATPAITMTGTGNVGIGTSSPSDKLHVAGLARFDLGGGRISMSTPGGWPGMIAFSPNGHRRDIIFDDSSIRFLISSSSSAASADNGITINEDGGVGIGTSSTGSFKLAVNGSAAKVGGGSWSTFSDVRLKDVGAEFQRGLSEIAALDPVWYNYSKDNKLGLPADKEFIGVVAQDVRKVIPEAVEENDKGYLMVNNDPIIWAMVNAIKELKAENDTLKQKVEFLEKRLP
jgi:hypothetical protein